MATPRATAGEEWGGERVLGTLTVHTTHGGVTPVRIQISHGTVCSVDWAKVMCVARAKTANAHAAVSKQHSMIVKHVHSVVVAQLSAHRIACSVLDSPRSAFVEHLPSLLFGFWCIAERVAETTVRMPTLIASAVRNEWTSASPNACGGASGALKNRDHGQMRREDARRKHRVCMCGGEGSCDVNVLARWTRTI